MNRKKRIILMVCALIVLTLWCKQSSDITFINKNFEEKSMFDRPAVAKNVTSFDKKVNESSMLGTPIDAGKHTSDVDTVQFHHDSSMILNRLVNESTIMNWVVPNEDSSNLYYIYEALINMYDVLNDTSISDVTQLTHIWTGQKKYIVVTGSGLCQTAQHFKRFGSVKKHVLIANLNSNWGALSTFVPNRTVNWGDIYMQWKGFGCNLTDIMEYLDHDNTLAVFTVQHQVLSHPKVYSVPLGVDGTLKAKAVLQHMKKPQLNRTQLLMMNFHESSTRKPLAESVLRNFNGTGLNNTYGKDTVEEYYDEMRRSKFIMSPSGLGWDCWRIWESLYMGVIPVIERFNRTDGWHRTLDELPVVWVDSFEKDLTPKWLEQQYEKVAFNASRYRWEKLTIPYWLSFIQSFDPVIDKAVDDNGDNGYFEASRKPTFDLTTSRDIRSFLQNHPKRVRICNTKKLKFNDSIPMIGQIDRPEYLIFNHSSKLAFGPKVTKTGSTSSLKALKMLLKVEDRDRIHISNSNELKQYTFYSFIRHPMERFLAGFHQVEVFWRMNWISNQIEQQGLQWWNKSCILVPNGTWQERDDRHHCSGSEPRYDVISRLGRLNAFLDDILEFGFFDQHIMPISYQISTSSLVTQLDEESQPTYFDIKSMNDVVKDLMEILSKASRDSIRENLTIHEMSRESNLNLMPWVVTWSELKDIASGSSEKEAYTAQSVIDKMCGIYENDIKCLPYDVPECLNKKRFKYG